MAKVMIESWVWDAICEHYASIKSPSADDERVMRYIVSKTNRQIAREAYMAQKRLDELNIVEEKSG